MISVVDRPTWDEHWIEAARNAARRSLCSRDQVGAVIVGHTNRVVATGHNNPPAGFDHDEQPCTVWCARAQKIETSNDLVLERPGGIATLPYGPTLDPGYTDCPSLHAEANALMWCGRDARESGTLYVTSHVCFSCAKLVANSGIVRVVVAPRDAAAHRSPHTGYAFLDKCGVRVEII